MASETLMKCAHPPCQCLVEAEQKYCSAACESAGGSARRPCVCDHPGCLDRETLASDEKEHFDPLVTE